MYNKICEFWNYFHNNHDKITHESFTRQDSVVDELQDILRSINSYLCFECDYPEGKNKLFCLSADGMDSVFQIINYIYNYKPSIEGLDFIKYRQPVNLLQNLSIDIGKRNLKGSKRTLAFSEILFTIEEHESGGTVINFFIPSHQKGNLSHEIPSWIVLDQCIGEYSVAKRIVLYNAFSINKAPQNAKSIVTLKSDLDALRLKRVKDFWSFFSENHMDFFCQDKESYFIDQLQKKLYLINHDLHCVLFREDDGNNSGKSALELTAEGVEEAFEDIELLDQYKPKIEKWNLYKYRSPYQNFTDDLRSQNFSDILFSLINSNDDKLTVIFFIPEFSENISDEDFHGFMELAWFILRATVGEYYVTKKLLCQCHPYQFADDKAKSVSYLESELAKIGY